VGAKGGAGSVDEVTIGDAAVECSDVPSAVIHDRSNHLHIGDYVELGEVKEDGPEVSWLL
jgi:hypothetical protein